MFQNALLQARETMQLATRSCEQMEAEIAQGKNPYADLIAMEWDDGMGRGARRAINQQCDQRRWLARAKMPVGMVGRWVRQQQAEASAASGGHSLVFVVPTVGIVPGIQTASSMVVFAD